jgi:hypothetical protein
MGERALSEQFMNKPHEPEDNVHPHDPLRRTVLVGMLATYLGSSFPSAAAAPAGDAGDAFIAASKILTGRGELDSTQSSRLYEAFVAADQQFADKVRALLAFIENRKIDPLRLQQVLDAEHLDFAAVPRQILRAWYVGVVGEGEEARCITFETNLSNVITADQLRPPSYCFGAPGSWTAKPT